MKQPKSQSVYILQLNESWTFFQDIIQFFSQKKKLLKRQE